LFFSGFSSQNNAWKSLIHTPDAFIPVQEKVKRMNKYLVSLGCSTSFQSLMVPLLVNGSISRLEQIAVDFTEINRAHKREIDVSLITGKSLDSATIEFYKSSIALDFLDPRDNIIFTYSVDPTIQGYKVRVKNKTYDFTHNNDLRDVQQKLNAKSDYYNHKESLFKELEGVCSTSDISRVWEEMEKKQGITPSKENKH